MKTKQSARFDVWVNPPAHQSAEAVTRVLKDVCHLVVVPKTGTRMADAAVLCDPTPAEVRRVRSILRDVPLLATTSEEPSTALRAEIRRCHGRLLWRPTSADLLEAVHRLREIADLPAQRATTQMTWAV